jgi:hypothetical protein
VLVEALLDGAGTHLDATPPSHENRPKATHAVLICACATQDHAPTWLIYEDRDGGIVWGRVHDGAEVSDVVDAEFSAGGHAAPGDVLAWLQGEVPDPWYGSEAWSGSGLAVELGRKILRSQRH